LLSRWPLALAAVLAAACCTVTPAQSATACGPAGFAYAGIQPSENGHGISAVLTALAVPVVESGHVAGWIGVGGPGQGPGGTDEWIQVGLNSMPGTGNTLYFEVMRPGSGVRYAEVATDVPVGQAVRVAVLETAATSGAWRVWVDGKAVTPPIALRSGDSLTPMAMGESWDGGQPACTRYRYGFQRLATAEARGGSWVAAGGVSVFQDPGYRVIQHAPAPFDAAATSLLPPGRALQSSPPEQAASPPRSAARKP